MDGAAIKELAARLQAPSEAMGALALPPGWTATNPDTIAPPQPEALAVYTLGALRDYLAANRDGLATGGLVVHVVSPQIVAVQGPLDVAHRTRETYVKATALNLTDGFLGKFMSVEEFIVGLQSRFAESDARASVLRLFGTVKQEAVKTSSDDGISQTVTAKAGVALVNDAVVPNPVTLAPFRTFREVTQPTSAFLLRVRGGGQHALPEVGLFEADGGAWRLVAVDRVRDWLREAISEDVAVIA